MRGTGDPSPTPAPSFCIGQHGNVGRAESEAFSPLGRRCHAKRDGCGVPSRYTRPHLQLKCAGRETRPLRCFPWVDVGQADSACRKNIRIGAQRTVKCNMDVGPYTIRFRLRTVPKANTINPWPPCVKGAKDFCEAKRPGDCLNTPLFTFSTPISDTPADHRGRWSLHHSIGFIHTGRQRLPNPLPNSHCAPCKTMIAPLHRYHPKSLPFQKGDFSFFAILFRCFVIY